MSTNAPKLVKRATVPSMTSFSLSESNNASFFSAFSKASTALRLSMTRLFAGSNSSTFNFKICPSKSEKSSMKSVEINEAGTKPLWPTSTTNPPFTTSVTLASIVSLLSNCSCKNSYDFSVSS